MDAEKRRRLEAAGFRLGSVEEFLGLTSAESALIEVKMSLSSNLKARRLAQHLSQATLARRIQTSQSRVARMEAGDPGVSIDLLVKALFAIGATREDLAGLIRTGADLGQEPR